MKNCIAVILFLCLQASALIAQDWNTTTFKVQIPPEFDLSPYKRILIAEILDKDRKSNNASDIYDEISNSILKIGTVEVVEREKVNLLLKEFEFQESGYVDESFFKEKGKFISTGLVLVGRIQSLDYQEKIEKKDKMVTVNGCSYANKRKGKYNLSFNFKLIDLEHAEVVFSKTITSFYNAETPSCDCCNPHELNKDEMYISCLKAFGNDIKKVFGGFTQEVKVTYQKNKLFNESLRQAIVYFNVNDNSMAFKQLIDISNAQTDVKAKSSALYNLALSQYFFMKFSEAQENAKKAYVLDPKNEEALNLFKNLDSLKTE
jgi:hypothetical protein